MIYVCYALCFLMAWLIINIYCKFTFHKWAKEVFNKKKIFLVIIFLGAFLCWAGSKPGPDEPDEPEPDEPDEPIVVEGIKIKLIGKNIDGKFIPLTSEWIQTDTTNIVEAIEQVTEELE